MKFEDWEQKKLGEVLNLKRGYDLPVKKRRFGSYPIISSSGENGFHNEFKVKGPGVITGRSGLLGHVYYIEEDFWPLNTSLYVEDFKGNNPLYIYYLLQTMNLENYNAGSSVPTLNRNHVHLLEVKIPVKSIQEKIAKTLYMFEQKIKLNNSTISNLEEIAQTLFKHWFVDFEFPNEEEKPYKSSGGKMVESELGMIPEGWEVETLDCLLELKKDSLKKGKHNDHKKYVPIDLLPMKQMTFTNYYPGTEAKSSLIEFKENDILLGAMRVYFHRVCLAPYDGITRTTCFVLRARENIYRYYALLKVFQDETINYANSTSKGTTIPYATWENGLSKLNVVVPTYDVLDRFNEIAAPIFLKLKSLSNQSQNLGKLRDTLLPKLLSGEIELPDDMEVTDDVPIS